MSYKDPEKKRQYMKAYRQKNREKIRAYDRHYSQEHREEISARMHNWYEATREKRLAQHHRWLEQNPDYFRRYYIEHREECRVSRRSYYETHREERVAAQSRWREENPDYARRYRQENPERDALSKARRKARKLIVPNTLTAKEVIHLLAIGQAVYPEESLNLDHVVPLSKGGGTTLANCHYIPARLNGSKKDALPEEVYQQLILCQP